MSFNRVYLKPGTVVRGKWHDRSYRIIRLLGRGSIGQVYLVQMGKKQYAMKISLDCLQLQSEINAIRHLIRKGACPQNFLIEVDDLVINQKILFFYIMSYIQGIELDQFIVLRGRQHIVPLSKQILTQLNILHTAGFVFGDLKPANILVRSNGQIQFVDFGGVTKAGLSIKQFTEKFDRGYWRKGDRVAKPSYDYFSFAILILHLITLTKRVRNSKETLVSEIFNHKDLNNLLRSVKRKSDFSPIVIQLIENMLQSHTNEVMLKHLVNEWKNIQLDTYMRRGRWISPMFYGSFLLFLSVVMYYYN